MTSILNIKDVKKSYKIDKQNSLTVLKGINLEIKKGEVIAIVGQSGAGKSTLLHILGTLDRPDNGNIIYGDQDITKYNEKDLASFRNKKIGFIFQFHHLLPEFTALENILIPAMIDGEDKKERAMELLEIVGVKNREEHKPSEISGGEAQRVAIARALINSPEIILADEPTGNLDTANANSVIELIFDLRNKFNQTFVIVTHNEEFAGKCDRIVKMKDGLIIS
ncbi:MAG TPA: lipoprotein-releasing system ATP-binding protein LolD [Bacteroidetes bacterium]|nr:ABC transporter ATP-binding protein [Ignavibacteria bacterium]HCA43254.1 lipoprotein-releasing system ATP-binding protein LolD [Bacteroidota bacterium]HCN38564.1 lipoprotein-releasing system ATP-binding protein LolD [Bacteroidota bacterium]